MADRFQAHGKQVLVDGAHFADARCSVAAAVIAEALVMLGGKIVDIRLKGSRADG